MNYYQITTGLDSDSDGEVDWMVTSENKQISKNKENDQENNSQATPGNENQNTNVQSPTFHQALEGCLTRDTLNDFKREYSKNTESSIAQEGKKEGAVVLRRKSSRNSYGQRASQRFSKIIEGVTSLVSLSPSSNMKTHESPADSKAEEDEEKCNSLPYWVEASQNISRRNIKEESDSGYSSIADTSNSEAIIQMEADGINEKISEIFDSMLMEKEQPLELVSEGVKMRKSARNEGGRAVQRRKTVSGYFQDWANWMGSMEGRTKDLEQMPSTEPQDTKGKVSRKSSSASTQDTYSSDSQIVEELWSTWDSILIEWNNSGKKKIPAVKDLVRRGIPKHLRGILWQILSGAHCSLEKTKYVDYLNTESACEKAIHRDIARTYPEHDFFKKKDGIGQEALFNVMKAYSVHDREVGYCQGSAFIVGLLLMQMPEEESFAVLVKMMEEYAMREMFKPSMAELGLCMYQLDILIQEHIPELHVHFQSQSVHTNLYASRWFLTLFTSSLPISISSRIIDCFLSEGREVIFRVSLALLLMAKDELLLKDMEGVTKYFQKDMPARFEADQDSVFTVAFSISINQKKMKRIEKEYMTMKTKEAEDEMEIRRLRTENRLVRQKMEMLEQESSDLADRLLQDQVTRAEKEENCFVMRQEMEMMKKSKEDTLRKVEDAEKKIKHLENSIEQTKAEAARREEEHNNLISSKNNIIRDLQNKMTQNGTSNTEDETANNENQKSEVDSWIFLCDQSKEELQELRHKIRDLKGMWKVHLQKSSHTEDGKHPSSGPKKLFSSLLDGTSEVGKLEEELISSQVRETEVLAELKEWKIRCLETQTQLKASRNQLSRQDDMVMRLQEELEDSRRKATDLKSQLKESHIKFSNLEGKLKDEQLMSRIKDAENTHSIAELRHQISSLELKNQEMVALGDLNWCLDDNEDTDVLQDTDSCFTDEVMLLSSQLRSEFLYLYSG